MTRLLSPLRLLVYRLVILLLCLEWCGPIQADDNVIQIQGKGPAYVEPPIDHPSYDLMGEFMGEITSGENQTEMLGLQIRPIGKAEFQALSFQGGLPGQDQHDGETMTRMIGQRSEDFLILSGGPWVIIVEKDGCVLLDRKGEKIGRLERVHRSSPTIGARPPENATVLFDGSGIDQFTKAQMTKDGLLTQGADIKPMFQDFNLHVEFRLPFMPEADGQSRGNSGLYLQSRYECQVLDSFGLEPMYNGCGSLYRFREPDVNMCLPPLVWQTYDIQFTAPRWAADGSKIRNAHITTWINGVKVQDNVSLPNKTGAGSEEEPNLLPCRLQDHGDPVRFRNIWIVDRGLHSGEFPIYPTEEERAAAAEKEQQPEQPEVVPAETAQPEQPEVVPAETAPAEAAPEASADSPADA